MIRFLSIAAIALLSLSVQAQEDSSSNTSKQPPTEDTKQMKQALEESTSVEDGAKQAPGGKAKPEENWFGCKPDESEQQKNCDDQTDDRSEKDNDS